MNIPKHIAFIMDGNGRWANQHGKPRIEGHKQGLVTAENVIDYCIGSGVKYVTLYVFSTENWKRPKAEIDGLFRIAKHFLTRFEQWLDKGVKLLFSGERDGLPNDLCRALDDMATKSAHNSVICLNLCINYGGRREIVSAVNNIIASGGVVTEATLTQNLYNNIPEPDIIVRTGGQQRLSNFLLYQSAYSELYFTDVLWPDFDKEQFDKVIVEYSNRTRNFGGLSK